ncbi:poly(3-hydroxyalkanoate) depolymerase [Epidermidibacterium keratini]
MPRAGAPTEFTRLIQVHGRDIRVRVRPGEGTPLVLFNGIGASIELLQPFVDALDASIPVIWFDIPGIGSSELPRTPYIFATMARRAGELLDTLGVQKVDVLGISWGGGLAQQFAVQNPRRCRRLVLVATATGFPMVPAHPKVLVRMLTPRRYRDPKYAAEIAPMLYGGQLRDDPQVASRFLAGHSRGASGRGYALQLLAGLGWSSIPLLPLIRQPTLIVAGDDDPLIPLANAKIMHALLPHSQLHVYHDGHLALITRAHELAPRIAAFLRPSRTRPTRGRAHGS